MAATAGRFLNDETRMTNFMSKHQITIQFPTEQHKRIFAEWMCDGSGEQDYMNCLDGDGAPPVRLGYHGEERKEFPADDKRRYGPFLCDNTIRVELIEEEGA